MAAAASIFVHTYRFFRGLRFRIAVSYAVFFAVLLVAMGFALEKGLQTIFQDQVEELLKDDWDAVKGYLRLDTKVGPDWFFDPYDPEESYIVNRLQQVYLLTDSEGHVLQYSAIYQGIGYDSRDYIKSTLKSNQKLFRVRYGKDGVPYLILGGPIIDEHHNKYFLAIGRPMQNNQKAAREFTWNYFKFLPLAIAFSSLLGWILAGRALRPVNDVASTAQQITHSNLDMQIPLRGAYDELDRMIEAFNSMMRRLNLSFEQIRQFSTDVSHELRTPLTVVRGQLEVALFTSETVEQFREAMVNALEDVERLSNIVRALLMLSQAESGQLVLNRTDVDLADMVRELVEQYQIPAEAAGVHLTEHVNGPCFIRADRVQMERLITNLLSNGIKYTPSGGQVTANLEEEGRSMKLIVEDNGVGISPDHLPHIFDRFYRVPSSDPEKGLGLGLSFVAWIVKVHGGTIHVESKPGQGTRFVVKLPAKEIRLDAETPAPSAAELPNPVN
ncbi:MAG TPA: ATP-binding protein [Bryobacteraceae bacterium]|nr:ATP-binding protein [Bryobacteraceae bacterium]